ncbi:MAG: hypothetical protein GF418_17200 [Chitinivibrionales bacterium]|nr:hypothetical protein [Chitinivibrionales bacterium]MBD3397357.1 hypothetical protein [Chitinivibrionales bacterium]
MLLCSLLFQRRSRALNALGLAAIIWLLLSPRSLFAPGFQLSFAATAGILLLYPVLSRNLLPESDRLFIVLLVKPVLRVFFVSVSAFAATAPVLMYHFGELSLFGLAANLVAVSLMTVTMNAFFAGTVAFALWPPAATAVMRAAEASLWVTCRIADFGASLPWATIALPVPPVELTLVFVMFLLGLAATGKDSFKGYVSWAAPGMFAVIPLVLLVRTWTMPMETISFSLAEGDIAGIRFPGGNCWLVGAGPETRYNRPYRDAIQPWLRGTLFGRLTTVVLPQTPTNIVHDLEPILQNHDVRELVLCHEPRDPLLQEDLQGFLGEYKVRLNLLHRPTAFVPSPGCTLRVYPGEGHAGYELR